MPGLVPGIQGGLRRRLRRRLFCSLPLSEKGMRTEGKPYGTASVLGHVRRFIHPHVLLALDCRDKPGNDEYVIISDS